jgi:hypothetical protein
VESVRWTDVWRERLHRHSLVEPAAPEQLADVVGAVCGIHAQVMPSAELSIGLRVASIRQRDIRSALTDDQALIRTYGLRGTVHILPRAELSLWLTALRTRTPPRSANPAERQGLPSERLPQVLEAMRDALHSGGGCLTKAELAEALRKRLGDWIAEDAQPAFGGWMPRWQLALAPAAWHGVLAFGPNRGSNVTYVGLPPLPQVNGFTAQQEVLRRYLHAYGPATPVEFARWFYSDVHAAGEVLLSLGDEVEEVDVEGWHAWRLRETSTVRPGHSVHLLPQFDCYVVGCHPRAQLLPESLPAALRKSGTAAPFNVLLVDGVVAGLWSRKRRGQRIEIRVGAYRALTRKQQVQAADQATRIGEILGGSVDLSFGEVEPRGHL